MTSYAEFLARKHATVPEHGHPCEPDDLTGDLFPFQRHIVAWAIRKGRAAIFADTGLGKTRMQLAWADRMTAVNGRALILAPLAVAEQTIREARRMSIDLAYARDGAGATGRLSITNYDRLHLFHPEQFTAVVLDESSVLKDVTTKTRDQLIDAFRDTPYRLACTATPAPNDLTELANHAEFLGAASRRQMLSTYFVTDLQRGWRVRGHAEQAMWRWVAGWAIACRRPSDLGYDDTGYNLPALNLRPHLLPVNEAPAGGTRDYPASYRYINGRRVLTTAAWIGIVPDDTPEHVTWTPPIIHPANPDPFLTERLRLVIEDRSKA